MAILHVHIGKKTLLERCQQLGPIWDKFHLRQMPATATCGPMKDGESRLSAPVFQTQGGDVEEDLTEEDGSEERTTVGERGIGSER